MKENEIARKVLVTIDGTNQFVAWTFEEKWNEWSCPYFEKVEADKVAKIHNCKYDKTNDTYVFEQTDETEEFEGLEIKTVDGVKKVYAIGNGSWIWDEVEWNQN